jgi:hypothetical protein
LPEKSLLKRKITPMLSTGGSSERRINIWILMSFAAKKGFRRRIHFHKPKKIFSVMHLDRE